MKSLFTNCLRIVVTTLAVVLIGRWGCGSLLRADTTSAETTKGAFGATQELAHLPYHLMGISFPAPVSPSLRLEPSAKIRHRTPTLFRYSTVALRLSSAGKVKALDWGYEENDSSYFKTFGPALKRLIFSPCLIRNKAKPFTLVGRLEVFGSNLGDSARLVLPFSPSGAVTNSDLFESTCAVNGIILPGVEEFPSYLEIASFPSETAFTAPLAILQIAIDSAGEMVDRSVFWADDSAFAQMCLLASGWGRYRPGVVLGKRHEAVFFVAIRYFRTTGKMPPPFQPMRPSSQLGFEKAGSPIGSILDLSQQRVRVFQDSADISFPALLATEVAALFTMAAGAMPDFWPVTTLLEIDSAGKSVFFRHEGLSRPEILKPLRQQLETRPFYPRLLWDEKSRQIVRSNCLVMALFTAQDSLAWRMSTIELPR